MQGEVVTASSISSYFQPELLSVGFILSGSFLPQAGILIGGSIWVLCEGYIRGGESCRDQINIDFLLLLRHIQVWSFLVWHHVPSAGALRAFFPWLTFSLSEWGGSLAFNSDFLRSIVLIESQFKLTILVLKYFKREDITVWTLFCRRSWLNRLSICELMKGHSQNLSQMIWHLSSVSAPLVAALMLPNFE